MPRAKERVSDQAVEAITTNSSLAFWLVLWLAAAAAIVVAHWIRSSGGLGLIAAYLLNLWLIHWLGAAVYLSNLPHKSDEELVIEGFKMSTYGIFAFAFGSIFLAPVLLDKMLPKEQRSADDVKMAVPLVYLAGGAFSYILLSSTAGQLPTLNSLAAAGQNLFVVGLCLLCWRSWHTGKKRDILKWLLIALMLPFVTVVFKGFIGYGAAGLIVVLTFLSALIRPRWFVFVAALLAAYLGLSIFISYAEVRDEIRADLTAGKPFAERANMIYESTIGLQRFDFNNIEHLDRIDSRLNQNMLVGAAERQLSTTGDFAQGTTIWESVIGLVPRFLWPDKPITAGSGTLVSQYTGILFDKRTSVGIGHVLEFYVNFGTLGIITGFMLLGTVITVLDVGARQRLRAGQWTGFSGMFIVGIACLQVGGSLVELTTTAGAGLIVVLLINRRMLRRERKAEIDEQGSAATEESAREDSAGELVETSPTR